MPLITPKVRCTGCTACKTACSQGCIEIVSDKYGFYFPEIIKPDALTVGCVILFPGTPCQVAGLRSFIGKTERLICADFICHGIPSPTVWKSYIEYRKHIDRDSHLKNINMRSSTGNYG